QHPQDPLHIQVVPNPQPAPLKKAPQSLKTTVIRLEGRADSSFVQRLAQQGNEWLAGDIRPIYREAFSVAAKQHKRGQRSPRSRSFELRISILQTFKTTDRLECEFPEAVCVDWSVHARHCATQLFRMGLRVGYERGSAAPTYLVAPVLVAL